MHILDEFIVDSFLHNISLLFKQQGIGEKITPVTTLIRFLTTSEYFCEEIFSIYTEHYKRIFTILEILAIKQGLDTNRQIFNLVRNHINKTNIKLTISDLVSIYLSYKSRKIIIPPEIITHKGLRLTNPE